MGNSGHGYVISSVEVALGKWLGGCKKGRPSLAAVVVLFSYVCACVCVCMCARDLQTKASSQCPQNSNSNNTATVVGHEKQASAVFFYLHLTLSLSLSLSRSLLASKSYAQDPKRGRLALEGEAGFEPRQLSHDATFANYFFHCVCVQCLLYMNCK